MKKNLLIGLAALAAVTITSCQKDQVINQVPQEQAIEFGTYVGRDAQTKGSVTNITTLRTNGFGVFAYYTAQTNFNDLIDRSSNFMYNQKVYDTTPEAAQTTWTYTPLKYWPNNTNDKISFFAYAPYDSDNSNALTLSANNATVPTVKYTVDEEVSKHIDLVYAPAHIDKTKQATVETINFNFFHALSRISFYVEAMVDEVNSDNTGGTDNNTVNGTIDGKTTITINSVILSGNFIESATLDLLTSSGTPSDGSNAAESTPYWTDPTINGIKEFEVSSTKGNVQITNVTTTKQQYNAENGYIMIIPQVFDDDDVNTIHDLITVTANYTVTTTDETDNKNNSVITNNISESFNFTFEPGKAYSFNLHIGLTSIKFDANVEDWDSADYVVNVPNND